MKVTKRVNPDGSVTVGIIEDEAPKAEKTPAPKPQKKPAKKTTK